MRFLAGERFLGETRQKLNFWLLLGAMVYTSILTVFLGVGSLLGYCSYNLYNIWPSDDPETNKNIFQVFFPSKTVFSSSLLTMISAVELDARDHRRLLEAEEHLAGVHLRRWHPLPRRRLSLHLPLAEDQNRHCLD